MDEQLEEKLQEFEGEFEKYEIKNTLIFFPICFRFCK
jgi:hypothetical protein